MNTREFAFERIVFRLSVIFIGLPFLAPWIVDSHPWTDPTRSLIMQNVIDMVAAFFFGGTVSLSLTINLWIFMRKRSTTWHRPLPRSVAIGQALLLGFIAAWLVTLQLHVTVFGHAEASAALIWFEAVAIAILSVQVCVQATREGVRQMPEGALLNDTDARWFDANG